MLEALRIKGLTKEPVAAPGFGNVGSVAARMAHEMGPKVIGDIFQGDNQRIRSFSAVGQYVDDWIMAGFEDSDDFKRGTWP
jgi:hypothetical protein